MRVRSADHAFGTSKRRLIGFVEYEDPKNTNDKYTASKDGAYTRE
jgi:hypothetical protein